MNQPRLIFKNTFFYIIGNLVNRFSNILVMFLMARTLQATGVGIYATAMAYFTVIDVATNMGATNFLVREIAKEPSKTNRYILHFSVVGVTFAAVVLVLFWMILPYLGYSAELTTSMYIIALAIIPGTLNTVQNSVFVAYQRVKYVTYTTFFATMLNLGLSFYLLTHGYGVVGLIVIFVVIQYLATLIYFYLINHFIMRLQWQFEFAFALTMIRQIKTFAALSILGALLAQPEVIILSLLVSETQVGFYSAALKVAGLWFFIPQIYMANVYPVLSRSFHVGDYKFGIIQQKSIKYLLAISLPLAVGIMTISGPIIRLLYGPDFEGSVWLLQILAWYIPLAFLQNVLWPVLIARNQQDLLLRIRIISLLVRFGSGFLLTVLLAAPGAAIATVISLLVDIFLMGFYVKQDSRQPLHIFSLSWRFAMAALGMGILIQFASQQVSLWLLIPIAGITYMGLIFLFRAFSADDWALFHQVWQPKFAGKNL